MLKVQAVLKSCLSSLYIGCSLCALLYLRTTFAQQMVPTNPSVEKAKRALSNLAVGNPDPMDAKVLADSNVTRAIPTLEKKFSSEEEPLSKSQYAAALVKLHDVSPQYWNYMSEQVENVLKDPLPTSAVYDAQGKQRVTTTEALRQWAKRHRLSESEAADSGASAGFLLLPVLASTGDRRAIPLLEQALATDNYFLHEGAVIGLVSLEDQGSVNVIAAALKKDPPQISNLIAHLLIWSSDPAAQQLAARYLTREELDNIQKQKAARKASVLPVTP